MIYRICINNEDIYGTDLDNSVISPSLEIELNSAGSLNFTLPPEHVQWDKPNVFVDEVDVYEDDDIIWFGRPLQVTRDWNNQKKVICEGALAYFNDSVQRPKEYKLKNTTLRQFFEDIIDMHNLQVATNRKIYPGNFTVDDVPVYRKVDYETTAECLQRYCLDTDGGYFILRKERNPEDPTEWLRYIDWVADLQGRSDQPVQFGLNMLDIAQDLNGADICTVLIPTGGDDLLVNNVATQTVNGCRHVKGEDEIVFVGAEDPTNPEGIHKYGRVLKQKEWSDIYDKDQLFQKACEWLVEQNTDIPTIECAAADLHYLPEYEDQYGSETGKFRVGQKVHVVSSIHGIGSEYVLPMFKISMNLDSGVKRITIGTPPKRELTDIIAPGTSGGSTRSSGKSSGSGGGGGSTYIPVVDVLTKVPGAEAYKSVVTKKKAKIDLSELGGGDVSDVTVNGTSVVDPETKVAEVVIPPPPAVPVQDVQVDNVSVVDQNGVANFDSSDFGSTNYYGVNFPIGSDRDLYFKTNKRVASSHYRFIKMVVTNRRGGNNDKTQFARFKLLTENDVAMTWPTGTTITTNVQYYSNEGPENLLTDSGKFCAFTLPTIIIELPQGSEINLNYSKYCWYTANDATDRDPVGWELYFSEDGIIYDLVDGVVGASSIVPLTRNTLGYSAEWATGNNDVKVLDFFINANGSWIKNALVKGVTYDGIDVVDPETGIAEITSTSAVGRLQDISWYERGPYDTEESNTRTTTLTEDGIYVAILYYSLVMNSDIFMMVGEFSLTTSATNVIREEYIDYKESYTYGAIARGKTIIFEGHAGDTVTFHATNNRYNLLSGQDTPSNPHAAGCYEIDKTNRMMILTPDTSRDYYKDYYAIVNPEGSNNHHTSIVGTMEHVFKIGSIDERYLSFIGEYLPEGKSTDLKTLIPNTDDSYLVYVMMPNDNDVQPVKYMEDGSDKYYDVLSLSGDPDTFHSLISSSRRIIHIGDGTYDSSLNTSHSYSNNAYNVAYMSGSYNSTYVVDGMSYAAIDSGRGFHSKSALVSLTTGSSEGEKYVMILRLSKPQGVLDVQVNGNTIVNENMIANIDTSELDIIDANPMDTNDYVNKLKINGDLYEIFVGEEVYQLATPLMTSNTTPTGVVSASSNAGNNYYPWYAFSGNLGNDGQTWVTASGQAIGAWIQYKFVNPVIIKKLATTNRNESNNRAVKKFKFQASNDGINFVDLATCTSSSSAGHYRQEFEIDNRKEYTYYRLYILETWVTNDSYAGFAQIEMCQRVPGSGESHNYSLVERKVGTWYDGSYIYEKTVNIGTPAYDAYTAYPHGISNFRKLIKAFGTCVKGGSGGYKIATPNMTSNTTPSGEVSASSYYNNSYAPWYAFSGTLGYDQQTWATAGGHTVGEWIQYKFDSAVTIKKLATTNRNEGNPRVVRKFIFQASNDGTNFDDLANCEITSNAGHYRQEFTINNSTAYLYYRLYVTEAWIQNDFTVGFAQVELYEPDENINLPVPLVGPTSGRDIFLGDVNGTNFYYQFGSDYNIISDFDVILQYIKSPS